MGSLCLLGDTEWLLAHELFLEIFLGKFQGFVRLFDQFLLVSERVRFRLLNNFTSRIYLHPCILRIMHWCTTFATLCKILVCMYVCMMRKEISRTETYPFQESMRESEGLYMGLFVVGKVNTCVYVHCTCIYEKRDKRRNGGASFIFDRRIRLDLFRRELEERAVWEKGWRGCWMCSNICISWRIILGFVSRMFTAFDSRIYIFVADRNIMRRVLWKKKKKKW